MRFNCAQLLSLHHNVPPAPAALAVTIKNGEAGHTVYTYMANN
ncbi:hypothetical protein [Klebsiella aerogenes EA1509E]|nr:hypothetical protein [Klebsiella aerogenes EA1509E]